jgi:ATP-dependent HslUV protease, peptidase subunit HslV
MIVADEQLSLTLTGNGDVFESHDGIIGIGSGGDYALGKFFMIVNLRRSSIHFTTSCCPSAL